MPIQATIGLGVPQQHVPVTACQLRRPIFGTFFRAYGSNIRAATFFLLPSSHVGKQCPGKIEISAKNVYFIALGC